MQVITKVIEYRRPDVFSLWPFGDLHSGSPHFVEDHFQAAVRKVVADPLAYWIGMGDMSDSITKNDKRFSSKDLAKWVEPDNIVPSQLAYMRGLLKPINSKGLALLTGNHEETIHHEHQNDITRNLAAGLKVPYGGYACFIRLIFRRKSSTESHEYIIHAWHGAGAAQTDGARVNRLLALVNHFEADIYLMGHLHAIKVERPERIVLRNGNVKSVKIIAALTGSWLRGYTQGDDEHPVNPTYIEQKGYKPTQIGCPVIKICPNEGLMWTEA